ncbi:MAG TPA: hypothetical protein VK629_01785 [Steroidobacteraceae bacterium]|nr:hypothetical protein [Steroidobacteraceae bacterium]
MSRKFISVTCLTLRRGETVAALLKTVVALLREHSNYRAYQAVAMQGLWWDRVIFFSFVTMAR